MSQSCNPSPLCHKKYTYPWCIFVHQYALGVHICIRGIIVLLLYPLTQLVKSNNYIFPVSGRARVRGFFWAAWENLLLTSNAQEAACLSQGEFFLESGGLVGKKNQWKKSRGPKVKAQIEALLEFIFFFFTFGFYFLSRDLSSGLVGDALTLALIF